MRLCYRVTYPSSSSVMDILIPLGVCAVYNAMSDCVDAMISRIEKCGSVSVCVCVCGYEWEGSSNQVQSEDEITV
jgi:hypothetical protein